MGPLPRLILTLGEPAGIGPDIVLKSVRHELQAQVVVIGDPDLLEDRARRLGTPIELTEYVPGAAPTLHTPGRCCYIRQALAQQVEPGKPASVNADSVLAAIEQAVRACRAGQFDAMVTGPVSKSVIADAGHAFQRAYRIHCRTLR